MNIYDLIKHKRFKYILCLITVILLASVIGISIRASEHKNDISLIEYYRLTHIAIILSTALVISLIALVSCHYYSAYMGRERAMSGDFSTTDRSPKLFDCTPYKAVNRSIELGIYVLSGILLISSISVYASTTEYQLYSESYYKRCTEGGCLLLASVSLFLVKYAYIFYKKYSGCKVKDVSVKPHLEMVSSLGGFRSYTPLKTLGNVPPREGDIPLNGMTPSERIMIAHRGI